MADLAKALRENREKFEGSLEGIVSDHGGILRCTVCGTEGDVHSQYFRVGWPTHCGYTMRWITARQLAGETSKDGRASDA